MAKGENKNSKANLKRYGSEKEPREEGKKGGIASGKARRELKLLRDVDADETTAKDRKDIIKAIVKKAKSGDYNAFREYCKITGQYKDPLDIMEQNAKIDKLIAETERIRAEIKRIESNVIDIPNITIINDTTKIKGDSENEQNT